jgi:hypothetical protein
VVDKAGFREPSPRVPNAAAVTATAAVVDADADPDGIHGGFGVNVLNQHRGVFKQQATPKVCAVSESEGHPLTMKPVEESQKELQQREEHQEKHPQQHDHAARATLMATVGNDAPIAAVKTDMGVKSDGGKPVKDVSCSAPAPAPAASKGAQEDLEPGEVPDQANDGGLIGVSAAAATRAATAAAAEARGAAAATGAGGEVARTAAGSRGAAVQKAAPGAGPQVGGLAGGLSSRRQGVGGLKARDKPLVVVLKGSIKPGKAGG